MIERDLQLEIEQLRKVKKAVREQEQDHSTALKTDTPAIGYLESLKGKFTFDQLVTPVSFCECSVTKDEIEGVIRALK